MSVQPIPQGYTSLTPFLVIDGAAAAIDFYVEVFGAQVIEKMDASDGTVAHAELDFGTGRLQLSDPNPDYELIAPPRSGPVTHSVVLYCPGCRRGGRPGRGRRCDDPGSDTDFRHR